MSVLQTDALPLGYPALKMFGVRAGSVPRGALDLGRIRSDVNRSFHPMMALVLLALIPVCPYCTALQTFSLLLSCNHFSYFNYHGRYSYHDFGRRRRWYEPRCKMLRGACTLARIQTLSRLQRPARAD